jgi:hypothetical protein
MSDEIIRIDATIPVTCHTVEIKLSDHALGWLCNYLTSFEYHCLRDSGGVEGYSEAAREIDAIGRALFEIKLAVGEIPF